MIPIYLIQFQCVPQCTLSNENKLLNLTLIYLVMGNLTFEFL